MLSTADVLNKTLVTATPIVKDRISKLSARLDGPEAGEFNSALRKSHFLAHALVESSYLQRMVENLNYTPQRIAQVFPHLAPRQIKLAHRPQDLANAAYANRLGNGDEASGDGWRYRGRGLLQHTFKDNYAELADGLKLDVVSNPDLLLDDQLAISAAIYYFRSRHCFAMADKDDILGTTKAITGAETAEDTREQLKDHLLRLFNAAP